MLQSVAAQAEIDSITIKQFSTGGRATAWCLFIDAEAFLSLSIFFHILISSADISSLNMIGLNLHDPTRVHASFSRSP